MSGWHTHNGGLLAPCRCAITNRISPLVVLTPAQLAAHDARVRAEALAPIEALASAWVGFDDSHHYGDAILAALPPRAAMDGPTA